MYSLTANDIWEFLSVEEIENDLENLLDDKISLIFEREDIGDGEYTDNHYVEEVHVQSISPDIMGTARVAFESCQATDCADIRLGHGGHAEFSFIIKAGQDELKLELDKVSYPERNDEI